MLRLFRAFLASRLRREGFLSRLVMELVEKELKIDYLLDKLRERGIKFRRDRERYKDIFDFTIYVGTVGLFIRTDSKTRVYQVTISINRRVRFSYVEGFLKGRDFHFHSKLESGEIAYKRDELYALINPGNEGFSVMFTMDEDSALVRKKIEIRCNVGRADNNERPEPGLELNERVALVRHPGKVGIVNCYRWHWNDKRYYYFLFIDGNYKGKRYDESELIRLEPGNEDAMKFKTINDWLAYVSELNILELSCLLYDDGSELERYFYQRAQGTPDPALLNRIEKKLRKRDIEPLFWELAFRYLPAEHLPALLINNLIENGVAIEQLGHLNLNDEYLLRLADRVDEAAITMGKRYYMDDQYSVGELESYLSRFTGLYWLWSSLINLKQRSLAKWKVLVKLLFTSTDFAELKEQVVDDNLSRYLTRTKSIEAVERYYRVGKPLFLKAIASNEVTPLNILEQLKENRGAKYSKVIRLAALDNIKKRKGG